jgi:hypothetical protein
MTAGRTWRAALAILTLVSLGDSRFSARADAQQPVIDSALLNAYRWRSIGPDLRRSIAVSGVKGRPREAYFGAVGGLWKTPCRNTAPVTEA